LVRTGPNARVSQPPAPHSVARAGFWKAQARCDTPSEPSAGIPCFSAALHFAEGAFMAVWPEKNFAQLADADRIGVAVLLAGELFGFRVVELHQRFVVAFDLMHLGTRYVEGEEPAGMC
jgi:hypothetical protein